MILETLIGVAAVLALIWFLWPILYPEDMPWTAYFDEDEL